MSDPVSVPLLAVGVIGCAVGSVLNSRAIRTLAKAQNKHEERYEHSARAEYWNAAEQRWQREPVENS